MLASSYFISILFLFILFFQVLSQTPCNSNEYFVPATNLCAIICPTRFYGSSYDGQPACLPQKRLKAVVRPTVEERVFILTFNDTPVPFIDATDFEQRVRVTLTSPTEPLIVANVSAVFLTESKKEIQILVNTEVIGTEAKLEIQFPNFQIRNNSESFIVGPVTFVSLPYAQLSDHDDDLIKALTKLDRGLEYAWITIACLNPYAFLYMNTKLYRETLEMFKKINVQYGALPTKFFLQNNNKVSGFKAPNMFPILLTDNDATSGWNRREENSLPFNDLNMERVGDLELDAVDPIHEYEAYPLFLDNYGIQITVFFVIIILIAAFEILHLIFGNKNFMKKSTFGKIFQAIRTFLKWNLLLASIIGSYQSLIFYIMVQIQAFASEDNHTGHNKLSFWFAIAALIILGLGFPIWLLYKIASIEKERRENKASYSSHKEAYGIFFMFYKLYQSRSFTFVFALMIRSIIFSTLIVLLSDNPIAQVATTLAFSIVFMIYLMILRPFSRLMYNIYQLGNEIILVFFLSTLLYLAHETDQDYISDLEGERAGYFLIAFWLFVPTLSIIFGLAGIAMRFMGYSTQIELKPSIPVVKASRQYQEEIPVKKSLEEGEVSKGKEIFSRSKIESRKYVQTPNAIAIPVNSENNEYEGYYPRRSRKTREYTTGVSRASYGPSSKVFEEREKVQESDESRQGTQCNRDLWNSSRSYKSQIKSLVYMSSFEKPKESYGARGIDLDDVELSPRSSTSQKRSKYVSPEKEKRKSRNKASLEVDKELIDALFEKHTSINLTKSVKFRNGDNNLEKSNYSVNNKSAKNLNELKIRKRTRGMNPAVLKHMMNKSKYLDSEGFKTNKERFASEDI